MRIVIETDHSDTTATTVAATASQADPDVLDGGPAPAALLRQFGRIEHAHNAADAGEAPEAIEAIEGGAAPPNPLRQGAEAAVQQNEE